MNQRYNAPALILGGVGALRLLANAFHLPSLSPEQLDALMNLLGFFFVVYGVLSHPKKKRRG